MSAKQGWGVTSCSGFSHDSVRLMSSKDGDKFFHKS